MQASPARIQAQQLMRYDSRADRVVRVVGAYGIRKQVVLAQEVRIVPVLKYLVPKHPEQQGRVIPKAVYYGGYGVGERCKRRLTCVMIIRR